MFYFIDSRRGKISSVGEKVYIRSRLSTAESEAVDDAKWLISRFTHGGVFNPGQIIYNPVLESLHCEEKSK